MAKEESKWYATGEEGVKRLAAEEAAAAKRRESGASGRRWRLKKDTEGKFTIIDNPNFYFSEHNLKIGDRWGNYYTCLRGKDTCPLDELGNPSYVMVCTIIDHRKWVDNKGVTHQNERKLLVTKGAAMKELRRQMDKRGGDVRLCMFEAARGDKPTECATGEHFTFVKKITEELLLKVKPKNLDKAEAKNWLTPFDYRVLFAPKTAAELRKLVGQAPPVGGDEDDAELPELREVDADQAGPEDIEELI